MPEEEEKDQERVAVVVAGSAQDLAHPCLAGPAGPAQAHAGGGDQGRPTPLGGGPRTRLHLHRARLALPAPMAPEEEAQMQEASPMILRAEAAARGRPPPSPPPPCPPVALPSPVPDPTRNTMSWAGMVIETEERRQGSETVVHARARRRADVANAAANERNRQVKRAAVRGG